MHRSLLTLSVTLAGALPLAAAVTGINAAHTDNFSYTTDPMTDQLSTTLAVGSVIQLGYFTISDVTDPAIWDTFVPLTGDGSGNLATYPANAAFDTYIGKGTDEGAGEQAGWWNLSANFDDTVPHDVPSTASRVGIRIFNGSSIATSTHYNTVTSSDSGWIMPAPDVAPQPAEADIDNLTGPRPPLTWESGATGTFQTSIALETTAVPEATEALIVLLGMAGLLSHRRRRQD